MCREFILGNLCFRQVPLILQCSLKTFPKKHDIIGTQKKPIFATTRSELSIVQGVAKKVFFGDVNCRFLSET